MSAPDIEEADELTTRIAGVVAAGIRNYASGEGSAAGFHGEPKTAVDALLQLERDAGQLGTYVAAAAVAVVRPRIDTDLIQRAQEAMDDIGPMPIAKSTAPDGTARLYQPGRGRLCEGGLPHDVARFVMRAHELTPALIAALREAEAKLAAIREVADDLAARGDAIAEANPDHVIHIEQCRQHASMIRAILDGKGEPTT